MKSFKDSQLTLRILFVLTESIVFFFGVGLIFEFFGLRFGAGTLLSLSAVSLAGLVTGLAGGKSGGTAIQKLLYAAAGIVASAVACLVDAFGSDPFVIAVKFVIYLFVWFLSIGRAFKDVRELFTMKRFLVKLTISAFSAAVISAPLLVVVFAAASMYGLLRSKKFSYEGGSNSGRLHAAELVGIIAVTASTFLVASPSAVSTLAGIFKSVYGTLAGLLMEAVRPVAWLLAGLITFTRSIRSVPPPGGQGSSSGGEAPLPDYNDLVGQSFLEKSSGVLTYIILAAAAVLVIYIFLRRLGKRSQETLSAGFSEERESVLDLGGNMRKTLGRIGNSFHNSLSALGRLNADNAWKLRHEYRKLLHSLERHGLLEGVTLTAGIISERLLEVFMEAGQDIAGLTLLYEETRYGRKLPTNEEYREFRRKTGRVMEIAAKYRKP